MATKEAESDPVAQYGQFLSDNKFVFVVFYRGHWCPFCQTYLRALEKLRPTITEAGGKVIAVTAETADHLSETRDLTGYTGDVIVDPENLLAAEMRRRGKVDVAITEKKGYAHGMAQPAVLVTQEDGKVYETWAIIPSAMNIGGAKDRPDLTQIWENVEAEMNGRPKVHEKYSLQTFFGTIFNHILGRKT